MLAFETRNSSASRFSRRGLLGILFNSVSQRAPPEALSLRADPVALVTLENTALPRRGLDFITAALKSVAFFAIRGKIMNLLGKVIFTNSSASFHRAVGSSTIASLAIAAAARRDETLQLSAPALSSERTADNALPP